MKKHCPFCASDNLEEVRGAISFPHVRCKDCGARGPTDVALFGMRDGMWLGFGGAWDERRLVTDALKAYIHWNDYEDAGPQYPEGMTRENEEAHWEDWYAECRRRCKVAMDLMREVT